MEKLYVKVIDEQIQGHPYLESNLIECFGSVDTSVYKPFIRIEPPTPGVFEVYEGVTYERDGEHFKDVHHIRCMTPEEKQEKLNYIIAMNPHPSWTVDMETGEYVPPIPYPIDNTGVIYAWSDEVENWVDRDSLID